MIKKEFKDILKPTIIKLLFLLIVPVLWISDRLFFGTDLNYLHVGVYWFGIIIFWATNSIMYSLFKSENEDHALEYLLSLPVSRYRILIYKTLPRIIILFIMIIIYVAAIYIIFDPYPDIDMMSLIHPRLLIPLVLAIILNGINIGLFRFGKLIAAIILLYLATTGLIWAMYLFIGNLLSGLFSESAFAGAFVISWSLLMIILFYPSMKSFKDFDLKPIEIHAKRYTRYVLKPLLSVIFISFLMILLRNIKII